MSGKVGWVGVRDLQRRLSHVLDWAAAGNVVRVTSRGRVKALIVPPSAEPWIGFAWKFIHDAARNEQAVREGWIRPPTVDEVPEVPERGFEGKTSIDEVLREDRDE